MSDTTHTIAALATAPAPAGIAVVRVSGPAAKKAVQSLFQAKRCPSDHPRELILGRIIDPGSQEELDVALATFMPGPESYTGEDIAEFQFHGSLLLVQKVLRALYSLGIEPAEPGEFTKRAFLNGKIDLIQAEAIGDLISSTSEEALKIASEQMRGRFSSAVEEIGEPLRDALAEIEASIDFPDEDIKPDTIQKISLSLSDSRTKIRKLIASYSFGHLVKDGFRVLLCGPPNAGKSSLLNLLLGTERAIVTDVAGTTRDLIEEEAIFSGYRFIFCDSAGLTESEDQVEKIGVELARERIPWADQVLMVIDASESADDKSASWRQVLESIKENTSKIWLIVNKIDSNPNAVSKFASSTDCCDRTFYLSAKTGAGLDFLTDALIEELSSRLPDRGESGLVVTAERHKNCLERARGALERTENAIDSKMPLEFVSAELRIALSSLEEIVGRTWTEDILGRIFSKFCIGK